MSWTTSASFVIWLTREVENTGFVESARAFVWVTRVMLRGSGQSSGGVDGSRPEQGKPVVQLLALNKV